jgi:hypothetical protein
MKVPRRCWNTPGLADYVGVDAMQRTRRVPTVQDDARRFWSKVTEGPVPPHAPVLGRCWIRSGAKNDVGYAQLWGTFSGVRKVGYAHRWAYELMIADIPDGLHIDHLCRVHDCVNPYHLDPVPNRVNTARGEAGVILAAANRARGAAVTHCLNGHPYSEENTGRQRKTGFRYCKTCSRERHQRRRRRPAAV